VAPPVLAALAAIALLATVGAVAVHQDERAVRHQASLRVRSNADAAVRALTDQSEDFTRTVQATAGTAQVKAALRARGSASLAAVESSLATLATSKDAPAAFLTDVKGRTVALYPGQPELIGKDFSFRGWFHGVSTTGRPYVSEAYRSAASGHPLVVAVAAPVNDGGGRVGYLTVLWQLESVRAVAEGARRDDGVTVTVTDQRGQPLTDALAVDNRGQPQQGTVPPTTRQALAGRRVSTVSDARFLAAAPVSALGWTVTATLPASLALAPAATFRSNLLLTLGVALLLVLTGLAFAVRATRRRAREVARADEERRRLAALFAASPIGILEGLPDGTILAVNDALARMLDYPVEELLTMTAADLAHPRSGPEISGALQGVLDGSVSSYTSERAYRTRDGSALPALVSVVVLRDERGRLRRMVTFVVDQRQQKADADALTALADSLAEREAFLATLLDTMDVAVLACNADGALTRVNHHTRVLHGVADDVALSDLALHLAHVDGTPMSPDQGPLVRALVEGDVADAELLLLPQDGRPPVHMLAHARRLVGSGGATVGAVVAAHDVTAARLTENALRASEDRFKRVFDEDLTGKALTDGSGVILRVNASLSRLLAVDAGELVGRALSSFFDDDADRQRVEDVVKTGQGEVHAEMSLHDAQGRQLWGLVAILWITEQEGRRVLLAQVEDVTARRVAEQRLTELALHDELTGLPNRRLLMERCEQAFGAARTGRTGTSVAALFVDLDGFKGVNDRAGHDAGDRLLASIADDLVSVLRPTDTVARVGGDEFVVLLNDDDGLAYVRAVADRVGTTVRRQILADGVSLTVTASIGIARVDLAHEPDVGPDQLLRRADAAMYQAKERGRDRHDVFDTDLHDRTEARQVLEQAVRDGLLQNRLTLVYQPVVDIDSGLVIGAEALMRLTSRDGRLLPTLPLIVAAEQAGLAERIGDRVLQLALEALRSWPAHMTVAVNVSARELTGRDFRSRVEQALRRHDVDPKRLVLEITESSILRAGPSALSDLEKLRQRGVRVAIDDFGTAYATLQNLTVLPVDVLKVDSSFTAGLPQQKTHTAVVHGIVSMAYEMDVPCIIEGVETEAQLAALRGMSVYGQGWLWGQPRAGDVTPSVLQIPETRSPGE
jgi:diguanylate cyclase (GGDEF)-like protein/PAS domain S-box-containing protein